MKTLQTCFCSFAILAAVALSGCTAVTVKPVPASLQMKRVSFKENPAVIVPGFLDIVRDGFDRHGIATTVISGDMPPGCEFQATYTALRSWDFTTYLALAEIRVEKDGRQVGFAKYHLRGKGGLSLMKWQGVKTKMDSVIDALLVEYPARAER